MRKTAEQIADEVLEKIAVSPALARKALLRHVAKATPPRTNRVSLAKKMEKTLGDAAEKNYRVGDRAVASYADPSSAGMHGESFHQGNMNLLDDMRALYKSKGGTRPK